MAEYITKEALRAFPIRANHYDGEHGNKHFINGIESVMEYAENLPAADVAPVVRCRECKYHREINERERMHLKPDVLICTNAEFFDNGWNPVWPADFCSYGERRE